MSFTFIATFAAGAVALAAWFEVRFPKAAPAELPQLLMHVFLATAATRFLFPQLTTLLASSGFAWAALFGVALPLTTYNMLVGFWTVRLLTGKFAQYGH